MGYRYELDDAQADLEYIICQLAEVRDTLRLCQSHLNLDFTDDTIDDHIQSAREDLNRVEELIAEREAEAQRDLERWYESQRG